MTSLYWMVFEGWNQKVCVTAIGVRVMVPGICNTPMTMAAMKRSDIHQGTGCFCVVMK